MVKSRMKKIIQLATCAKYCQDQYFVYQNKEFKGLWHKAMEDFMKAIYEYQTHSVKIVSKDPEYYVKLRPFTTKTGETYYIEGEKRILKNDLF